MYIFSSDLIRILYQTTIENNKNKKRKKKEIVMRLKELEGYLQRVRPFKDPKILLEQYPTSPHIASHLLYTMESTYADIDGKVVCDLGVGCGILAIGCAMLGAGLVIGCDIDKDALEIAQHNAGMLEIDNLELVHLDIGSRPGSHLPPLPLMRADTVVMNPPFGTKKNAGIDMNFLEQASRVSGCFQNYIWVFDVNKLQIHPLFETVVFSQIVNAFHLCYVTMTFH